MPDAKAALAAFISALLSAAGGVAVIVAAFKFTALNWIVDGPGWLVSRFLPIDFHEGDGAFGFFLSIFLSWLAASFVVWLLLRAVRHYLARPTKVQT